MVDPPEVEQILRLKKDGWGARRIGRELGISRTTVRRYLGLGRFEPYRRESVGDVLADHRRWAEERFMEVRGNVRVLHRELSRRGLELGYSTVARAVKPLRERLAALERATTRFETAPGEQMQVDFGELIVEVAGARTKVHLCVLTLGYSRRTFVRAYLSERQEQWLATLETGFHHFGGVPRELLIDNAKALVKEHDSETGQVTFTDGLLAFCRLHGTKPHACRPFRARTKGKVESGVKYVKRNALAGVSFESFAALEAHLEAWTRDVADVRVHGTTFERPIDRFEAERSALSPLRVVSVLPLPQERRVPSDGLVQVDTNRYQVPAEYVGRTVEVLLAAGMLAIRCDGREVVRYAELRGRHHCATRPGFASVIGHLAPPVVEASVEADLLAPYAALVGAP
jgi:transposase